MKQGRGLVGRGAGLGRGGRGGLVESLGQHLLQLFQLGVGVLQRLDGLLLVALVTHAELSDGYQRNQNRGDTFALQL